MQSNSLLQAHPCLFTAPGLEKVPTGQGSLVVGVSQKKLAGHFWHLSRDVRPPVVMYDPRGQFTTGPSLGQTWPMGHRTHRLRFCATVSPSLHFVHEVAPVDDIQLKLLGHGEHWVTADLLENVPGTHSMHAPAPAGEYDPGSQGMQ